MSTHRQAYEGLPTLFEDPETSPFSSRFIFKPAGNWNGNFTMLFGFERHMCPGMHVALQSTFISIARYVPPGPNNRPPHLARDPPDLHGQINTAHMDQNNNVTSSKHNNAATHPALWHCIEPASPGCAASPHKHPTAFVDMHAPPACVNPPILLFQLWHFHRRRLCLCPNRSV
jgi:hypothetical protein